MIRVNLRLGDGIRNRVWLRSVVSAVQQGLVNAEFAPNTPQSVDGLFGRNTARAIKRFQQANKLPATGQFDSLEWKALGPFLPKPSESYVTLLPKFQGDLDWIHRQEGFRGRPYWPGGRSGVTLEPGLDIGHASIELIEQLYSPILTRTQMAAIRKVYGFKGNDARIAIQSSKVLQSIRITHHQSVELMPHTAAPYWNGIASRFGGLRRKDTPPSVQTALLSIAYNRGILNRHLEILAQPISEKCWDELAELIQKMQQNHRLAGIRKRRREEGMLIAAELDFIQSQNRSRTKTGFWRFK